VRLFEAGLDGFVSVRYAGFNVHCGIAWLPHVIEKYGAPGEIRTPDPLVRRQGQRLFEVYRISGILSVFD
jgi:hypothetical protein